MLRSSDEVTLLDLFPFDFKCDRGGIQYPTTESKTMSNPNPDEGFIDVRFVLHRDDYPAAAPVIIRVERMGYLLPEGTDKNDIEYLITELWDEPHELVRDITGAIKGVIK